MRSILRTVIALLLAAVSWQAPLVAAFPSPKGFVNDFAGVLNDATRTDLESLLRSTADTTSAEVVLVTVVSLDGLTVEEYAVRLFELWGIGKKATDNGVLILVSPADREMRIEVGYGLEPILPDGLAGEIIRSAFLPSFRNGNYSEGIQQGVVRVVDVVQRGETASQQVYADDDRPPVWFVIPFFAVFVGLGFFAIGIGVRSKTYGAILFGSLFAVIPITMVLFQFFGPAIPILGVVAAALFAAGYSKGGSRYWTTTLRGSSGVDDGWVAGTTSSSSDGSGSSSGSDFGGGSSGGGGASGRW